MIKLVLNLLIGFLILNFIFTLVFGIFFPWGIRKYKAFRTKEIKMEEEIEKIKEME